MLDMGRTPRPFVATSVNEYHRFQHITYTKNVERSTFKYTTDVSVSMAQKREYVTAAGVAPASLGLAATTSVSSSSMSARPTISSRVRNPMGAISPRHSSATMNRKLITSSGCPLNLARSSGSCAPYYWNQLPALVVGLRIQGSWVQGVGCRV